MSGKCVALEKNPTKGEGKKATKFKASGKL